MYCEYACALRRCQEICFHIGVVQAGTEVTYLDGFLEPELSGCSAGARRVHSGSQVTLQFRLLTLEQRSRKSGGDGWESNPPRAPQQRPANGFEDRGRHQ